MYHIMRFPPGTSIYDLRPGSRNGELCSSHANKDLAVREADMRTMHYGPTHAVFDDSLPGIRFKHVYTSRVRG